MNPLVTVVVVAVVALMVMTSSFVLCAALTSTPIDDNDSTAIVNSTTTQFLDLVQSIHLKSHFRLESQLKNNVPQALEIITTLSKQMSSAGDTTTTNPLPSFKEILSNYCINEMMCEPGLEALVKLGTRSMLSFPGASATQTLHKLFHSMNMRAMRNSSFKKLYKEITATPAKQRTRGRSSISSNSTPVSQLLAALRQGLLIEDKYGLNGRAMEAALGHHGGRHAAGLVRRGFKDQQHHHSTNQKQEEDDKEEEVDDEDSIVTTSDHQGNTLNNHYLRTTTHDMMMFGTPVKNQSSAISLIIIIEPMFIFSMYI